MIGLLIDIVVLVLIVWVVVTVVRAISNRG